MNDTGDEQDQCGIIQDFDLDLLMNCSHTNEGNEASFVPLETLLASLEVDDLNVETNVFEQYLSPSFKNEQHAHAQNINLAGSVASHVIPTQIAISSCDVLKNNEIKDYSITNAEMMKKPNIDIQPFIVLVKQLNLTTCPLPLCSRKLANKRTLVEHLTYYHSNIRKFKCSMCSSAFKSNSYRKKHEAIHTNKRDYKCHLCLKSFFREDNLKYHYHTHSGIKPHQCHCGVKFRFKSTLIIHMRIHTGEKPYECQICRKKFKSRSELISHTNIHSNERKFKCLECGKRFNQSNSLTRHKKTHIRRAKE